MTLAKARLLASVTGVPIEGNDSLYSQNQITVTTDASGNVIKIDDQANYKSHDVITAGDAEGKLIAGSVDGNGLPSLDFIYLGRWRSGGYINTNLPSTTMPYVLSNATDRNGSTLLGGPSNIWLSYDLNAGQQYISAQRTSNTTEHDAGTLTMGKLALNFDTSDVRFDAILNMKPYEANPGGDFTLTGRGSLNYGNTRFSGDLAVSCALAANCGQPDPAKGYWNGNLVGEFAERSALAFNFRHQDMGDVAGAAVFDRGSDTSYSTYLPSRIGKLTSTTAKLALGILAPVPGSTVQVNPAGNDPSNGIKTDMGQKVVGLEYAAGQEGDLAQSANSTDFQHPDVEGRLVAGSASKDLQTSQIVATDDFAYLGRWRAGGTSNSTGTPPSMDAMTFVAGSETSMSFAQQAAKDGFGSQQVLNYSLVDSTAQYLTALRPDGSVDHAAGQLTSASLSVNPYVGSAYVNLNLDMNAYNARAATVINATGNMFMDANKPDSTSFAGTISSFDGVTLSGNASGMLIGRNAERAGLSIGLDHPDFGAIGASAILDRGANTTP